MVPLEWFTLEAYDCEDREDRECDDLLNDLELHKCEWSAIALESVAVGWYHEDVLEESHSPREEDDSVEWCVFWEYLHLCEFKMTVPSKGHEDVGDDKKTNCYKVIHERVFNYELKNKNGKRESRYYL